MNDPALGEWERGPQALRRLRRTLDARGAAALDGAEAAVRAELVRRLGPSYDLATLLALYRDADGWGREAITAAFAPLRVPGALAPILDTAFLHASHGARDR